MKKINTVLIILNIITFGLLLMSVDYMGQPIWVVRDAGSAFGVRHYADTDCRWRVQANGVQLWCNGVKAFAAFGPIVQPDGRVLFEFNALDAPTGIVLTTPGKSAISLTADGNCLVIRDERAGPDHVLGVIGRCE